MSEIIVDLGNGPQFGQDVAAPIKRRIENGRSHRKQFEPIWHSNLAFASGKHWLEWDRFNRQLVLPADLRDKELYTADVITEYRTTALGELGSDDDRPELLLRRDDAPSEDFQGELNKAVGWGWDHEWDGDAALAEADRLVIDLGTAAVRCRFDPTVGGVIDENVPYVDGRPVMGQQATQLFQEGPSQNIQMRPVRQGRICWDVLSTFNIIVPPGVPHERYFPWECIVRPVPLEKVRQEFGDAAADLREDTDIGSVYGWTVDSGPDIRTMGAGARGRLRDHVWLFTYLERPTGQFPNGRTVVLAGNQMLPLRFDNKLPYRSPDGTPTSGITYFHWWRVTGRFWSRSLIDVMKDGQRTINKRRTQIDQIIDRGMPYVLVQKDSEARNRTGSPVELIEIGQQERPPVPVSGVAPGNWMQADVEAIREDITHATGIQAVRLGQNPTNVSTYSQLALVNENDQGKRQQIIAERKVGISRLVESSVYDMRTYWGPQRQLMLAGDNDMVDTALFNATQIPPFFIVKVAKGMPRPRSQAAELQKIEDIARYSLESQQPLPVKWFKESLDAGQPLAIPEQQTDEQVDKAELENHMMLLGNPVHVDYFDPPDTHIPIHRSAQIQARLSGQQPLYDLIEQHVQEHLAAAQANAQATAAAASGQPQQPQQPPGPQQDFQAFPPFGLRLNRPI